jgi:CheY-like chemotaxis protein
MQKWILAVSPDTSFLEQISAHLQEGGRFLVICAANGKEALTAAGSQPFDLAILDAEINDLPFVPLSRELTALIPNLRMLVYPPNNNPKHPALTGLIASGFLNKPFFGPEVISKITNIFKEIPPDQLADQRSDKTLPELWVEDPSSGALQIEQLLGATSATAGLLMMRGQVIAATGALSVESNTNIVNFLTRYWTNIQSGELFRYLRMNFETVTYLVYAVPLFKNVAISLVYHPGVSLDEIRNEVTNLRKGFLNRYTNTGELRHDFGVQNSSPGFGRINRSGTNSSARENASHSL